MHFFLKKVAKTFGGFKKNPYLCTRNSEIQQSLINLDFMFYG